jgi:WD40 repeat protein/DNA-binding SARP family transcriptional activator
MLIGVLGPLEIRGRPARLTPRDRVVVEALASRHGQVVAPDALAEALWGSQPPASWAKVLQGAVVRLRRELGRDAVEWTGSGYRLSVTEDEIDAPTFAAGVKRGRLLMDEREPARAVVAYDHALAIWRGPPLPAVQDWPPGADTAAQLSQLHASAREERLDAALACGRIAEVIPEARQLVDDDPYRERGWYVLAAALYGAGRQNEALDVLRHAARTLRDDLGLEMSPMLSDLQQAVLRQDPSLPRPGVSPASPVCPFPGLGAFQAGDADVFTGREDDVDACLVKLADHPVLAIVGPSGCGKSSLARAGLVPRLRAAGRPTVVMTPGPDPLGALAATLADAPAEAVLVVDQVEELAAVADPDVTAAFHGELVDWASTGAVVLTVRADRLADVAGSSALTELVEQGLHLLAPLAGERLRRVVEEPARRCGLVLEAGLTDLLLRDVEGRPGALPLLSHALRQTWHVRDGNVLTVEGYVEAGRIDGAVAKTADQVFHSLTGPQRTVLKGLLLRLVTQPGDGAPVAARLPAAVIDRQEAADAVVERLVASRLVTRDDSGVALAHESLVLAWPRLRAWLDEDVEGRQILTHLQVAAAGWTRDGRPDSDLYRGARLQAALEWRERASPVLSDDEDGFLAASARREYDEVRSRQLAIDRQRRQNRRLQVALATVAVLLIAALTAGGFATRAQAVAEREERVAAARELAAAAAAARLSDPDLSLLLATKAVERTRDVDGSVVPEAMDALYAGIAGATVISTFAGGGGSLDVSPDGSLFVTEGPEGTGSVDVREVATGRSVRTWPGHGVDVNDVAFGGDDTLVTAGDDGSLAAWDADTGVLRRRVTLPGTTAAAPDVVWSPSVDAAGRRMVAIWDGSNQAVVTDIASGDQLLDYRPPADRQLRAVALSPDGATLAAVLYPPAIVLHDVVTGEEVGRLGGFETLAEVVEWSPDGRWIAGVGDDHARVWRADDLELAAVARGHRGIVTAVDWSGDSRRFATVGDGQVKVWELDEVGVRLVATRSSAGTSSGISGVAMGPDGLTVLVGDTAVTTVTLFDVERDETAAWLTFPATGDVVDVTPDGDVVTLTDEPGPAMTVWDIDTGDEVRRVGPTEPRPPDDPYWALDVSPDGSLVALVATDTVTVWDLAADRAVFTSPTTDLWIQAVAWSPDGGHLALGAAEAVVLDRSGREVATLPTAPGWNVTSLDFSPDGSDLVVARAPSEAPDLSERFLDVWDWTRGQRRSTWALDGAAFTTQMFDDGTLVTGSFRGHLDVWDVEDGRLQRRVGGHSGGVVASAVTGDGRTLVTTGRDGTVRVWDPALDNTPVTIAGSPSEISSIAVSPDGRHVVAAFREEGLARVWSLDVDEVLRRAEEFASRELTDQECRQYLRTPTC